MLSSRIFIVGADDTLYRLAGTQFSDMLAAPDKHRISYFAGQRMRMAEAFVEVNELQIPLRVVMLVYEMLRFDELGRFDSEFFNLHHAALVDVFLGKALQKITTDNHDAEIIVATNHFVAQGSRWNPAPSLERLIYQAALDEIKCKVGVLDFV